MLAIVILVLGNRTSALQSRDRKAIQSETDLKISQNERETAVAKSEASQANARAEEAKKTAEGFKLGIARAHEQAALLEKQAADAKLEQEKLKEQLAWRTIPSDQIEKMVAALSKGPASITIAYVSNDPEALWLGIQLSKVFERAGWGVNAQGRVYNDQLLFGLFVNGAGPEANLVKKVFADVGVGFSTEPVPPPPIAYMVVSPPPPVLVMIGSKQPPF